jgi:phosphotransferase system HPr (HPr) family protein
VATVSADISSRTRLDSSEQNPSKDAAAVRASRDDTMTKRQQVVAEEAIGNVVIKAERGLDPLLARRIRERVVAFSCAVMLHNESGGSADARSILQMLMLAAPAGEPLVLHCYGPGAHTAYAVVAELTETLGGAQ